jgi:hypothetical protein
LLDSAKIAYDPGGKENIIAANSSLLGCIGNVILDIHIDNGKKLKIDALVVSHLSSNCLIDKTDMQIARLISPIFPAKVHQIKVPEKKLKPVIFTPPTTDALKSLIAEFSDVFNDETLIPVCGEPMQIHMMRDDPNYKPTRISTSRKVPLHFKKEADKTLDWFLKSGVIVPVPPHEQVEWCSPGFFVAKPNGKCRLVVDMRDINLFINRPVHPFPSPQDVVKNIKPESKYFCSLDALSGYYQILLDEESSFLTTFLLLQGRYRFLRAPMHRYEKFKLCFFSQNRRHTFCRTRSDKNRRRFFITSRN